MLARKIESIVAQLSDFKDTNFSQNICLALANAIDANLVFIANINYIEDTATTVACAQNNALQENFTYELANSPCEDLVNGGLCSHSDNIQQLYPKDQLLVDMGITGYIGIPLKNSANETPAILVALFKHTIEHPKAVESLFLLFSGLIEKDLEAQLFVKRLELSNHIINESKEAIVISNKHNQIIQVNKAFTDITGYSEAEVLGKDPGILGSEKNSALIYQEMWQELSQHGSWSGEVINQRKNGEEFPELLSINSIHDDQGNLTNYAAFFFDITARKKSEEKIFKQANFDLLTGLANRYFYMDKVAKNIAMAHLTDVPALVLTMDLDLFTEVNNLYGHDFGDELLKAVANRLQSLIANNDLAARTSGDGFALLINNLKHHDDINAFISKLHKAFNKPFYIQETSVYCTLSIGATLINNETETAQKVMKKAEYAMHHAKKGGRNSFEFFTDNLQSQVEQRLALKNDLQQALNNQALTVEFQPIIEVNNNKVTKFEALVRWQHKGQWISPAVFIPIAEEFGMIKPLGEFVLRTTCFQIKALNSQGFNDVIINVNRSVAEIPLNKKHNAQWLNTIRETGIKASSICFEITESSLATNNYNNEELLHYLQHAGCTIALDDFGTGYSSLSYLSRFPIDFLKIDQAFVKEMTSNKDQHTLVATIIVMAKALGKKVVAEGVETQAQLASLMALDCDFIQGYYYSKPLSGEQLAPFIRSFKQES